MVDGKSEPPAEAGGKDGNSPSFPLRLLPQPALFILPAACGGREALSTLVFQRQHVAPYQELWNFARPRVKV